MTECRRSPQQSGQILTGAPKPAVDGSGGSCPFPYRSDTWIFEQPSARELEERLAVAASAADIGIWDLDVLSGSLLWCPRSAKIFGAPLKQGGWKEAIFERIHVDDRERVHSTLEAALDASGTGPF